jgi:hypothetical protein
MPRNHVSAATYMRARVSAGGAEHLWVRGTSATVSTRSLDPRASSRISETVLTNADRCIIVAGNNEPCPLRKEKVHPRKLRPSARAPCTRVATARMSARHLRRAAQSCGPAVADPADDGEVDDDEEYTDVAPAKPSFFAVRFCVAVQAPPRFLLNACSLRAAPRCGRV